MFLTNFSKTDIATPVWGQLNVPVRSTLAVEVASSSSEDCSTIPSNSFNILIALLTLTGSPIWIAFARVVFADTGSKDLKSFK